MYRRIRLACGGASPHLQMHPGAEMDADTIGTERLLLTPLGVGDADELVGVLADPGLHEFIGAGPRPWRSCGPASPP